MNVVDAAEPDGAADRVSEAVPSTSAAGHGPPEEGEVCERRQREQAEDGRQQRRREEDEHAEDVRE